MKPWLEKAGSIGAVVAAAACPVCFPKLALLGALFGLGAFGAYEAQVFLAAQALVVVAVIGHVLSYLRHRNAWLLAGAIAAAAAVFAGLYWVRSEALIYAGFAGLVAASATEFWSRRRHTKELTWNRE
jgi:mercuric ion transport protein